MHDSDYNDSMNNVVNSTDTLPISAIEWGNILAILKGTLGLWTFAASTLLLIAIACYPTLRKAKEHLLIGYVSLCDSLLGLAVLTESVQSLARYKDPRYLILNSWMCMWQIPKTTLFNIALPMVAGSMVAISIDRVLALAIPLRYFSFTKTYAKRMCLGALLVSALGTGTIYVSAWLHRHQRPTVCGIIAGIKPGWLSHLFLFVYLMLLPALSVLLYVCVPCLYRRYVRKMQNAPNTFINGSVKQLQIKTQRQLTITFGLSAISTLVFVVVGTFLRIVLNYMFAADEFYIVACALNTSLILNQSLNIALYIIRHPQLRRGMHFVLTCHRSFTESHSKNIVNVQPMAGRLNSSKQTPSIKTSADLQKANIPVKMIKSGTVGVTHA